MTPFDLDLGTKMTTVTNPKPVISWTDPTLDSSGNPLVPSDSPTQYLVGIRDVNAAGSAVGTYPNTYTATGGGATSCPLSDLGLALVYGHTYAVAAESQVGNPETLQSTWSAEYQFLWEPIAAPAAPTGVAVA